ncbi:MAG: (2Fe-2S)-binding protein [Pyrinomonadaceae bacterium]
MSIALILSKTALVAKLIEVPVYPKEIAELIKEPRFCGGLKNANAVGSEAKFDCGCFVHIEMRIDGSSSRIETIAYNTNGCGYMAAAAESISSRLRGMHLTELQGQIGIGPEFDDRPECSSALLKATQAAFADHRTRRVEEFRGEKALICTCFGVAEETVEEFVRSSHPVHVSAVSESIRAGSGCGSCRMLIQEIIDANA